MVRLVFENQDDNVENFDYTTSLLCTGRKKFSDTSLPHSKIFLLIEAASAHKKK